MRPEFDSEIDSVLRGSARRGGALSAALEGGLRASLSDKTAHAAHLDADEIAAFGENALPAAARARYSAHLADCDDCRRSVTRVALAAGVADRVEESARGVAAASALATGSPSAATQSASWRERLSAIFAPRAWRYAMPVVALLAVSAVVLVVMRNSTPESLTETGQRRGNASQDKAATAAAPEMHHGGAAQPPPVGTLPSNTGTSGTASATGEVEGPRVAAGEVAKISPQVTDSVDQSAGVGTAGSQVGAAQPIQAAPAPPPIQTYEQATAATPVPATPPPPAPAAAPRSMVLREITALPATPVPTPADADQARDDSRGALQRDEPTATKRHGPQRNMGGRAAELSSAAEATKEERAARSRARGPQKNEANRNAPEESKARREEDREQQQAETRTVAGRRFRREGNVWIDTAYRAGQATVVMRVNSEQYRALVGDEPEIDRISRALRGEVVVIWKGRAYRVKP